MDTDDNPGFQHADYDWLKSLRIEINQCFPNVKSDLFLKEIINEFFDNPIWMHTNALRPITGEMRQYYNDILFKEKEVVGECPILGCTFVGSVRMLYLHYYQRHGVNSGIILRCPFCLWGKHIINKNGNFTNAMARYHFLRCSLNNND